MKKLFIFLSLSLIHETTHAKGFNELLKELFSSKNTIKLTDKEIQLREFKKKLSLKNQNLISKQLFNFKKATRSKKGVKNLL